MEFMSFIRSMQFINSGEIVDFVDHDIEEADYVYSMTLVLFDCNNCYYVLNP